MEEAESDMIEWDDLIYIADLLEASNEYRISLLGGEPTLHPFFIDYVLYLLERKFHVNIFTNGIVPPKKLLEMNHYFENKKSEQLSFVCNVNPPDICTENEKLAVYRFFKLFNKKTSLSINIYRADYDLTFALDYIMQFGLKPHTRIGLAHPIPGKKNTTVSLKDYNAMAENLMSFYPRYETRKITLGFDCGMPMCIFSDEQLGKLSKLAALDSKFSCGPAIDIGPNMDVWSCFPLSGFHRKSLFEFDSMKEVYEYFHKIHKTIREKKKGIFDNCDQCVYLERGRCAGGCASHFISDIENKVGNIGDKADE
jgi:hypothetical protein